MASVDPDAKRAFANLDWDHYMRSRPPYPPSLTDIIYKYRQKHPNARWERLVDIGCGVGIASINFVADFQIVHLSDPSPDNQARARKFLTNWTESHELKTKLEFSQSVGEEAYKHTGENAVDLVICGTAAHYMDPDGLVQSVAKMLRPGGTLAIYNYWMPIFPDQSDRFNAIFVATTSKCMNESFTTSDEATRSMIRRVVARSTAGLGGLDFVPLPAEDFDDPQRVRINSANGEMLYNGRFQDILGGNIDPDPSRVSSNDQISTYYTGTDKEAEGWSFDVDKAWIHGFIDTLRVALEPLPTGSEDQVFQELDEIFDRECSSGTTRSVWPVHILLGTRK